MVCAECEAAADKVLQHTAEELAEDLDYCRHNTTYEGCEKCRRMKRHPESEDCFDDLLRDAANMIRALALSEGEGK